MKKVFLILSIIGFMLIGANSAMALVTVYQPAPQDMEGVEITEVIPKSVAISVSDIVFHGEQPKILQEDPIVQWTFDAVEEGETKDLSYTVKKELKAVKSKTVATTTTDLAPEEEVAEEIAPPAPETTGLVTVIVIVAAVIIAAAGSAYWYYKKKK